MYVLVSSLSLVSRCFQLSYFKEVDLATWFCRGVRLAFLNDYLPGAREEGSLVDLFRQSLTVEWVKGGSQNIHTGTVPVLYNTVLVWY